MGIFSIFSKKNKDESSEIKKNEESVKVQTNDDVLSENKEKIVNYLTISLIFLKHLYYFF